jgi:hypothetical protein
MIHLPFQAVNHSSTSHRSPESKFQSDAVAHGPAGLTCPIRIEVGDHGNLEPGDGRHLGEKHRAELAGADERHANGAACIEPSAEQC